MASVIDIIIDATWRGSGDTRRAERDMGNLGASGKKAQTGMAGAAKSTTALRGALTTLVGAGVLFAVGRQFSDFARDSLNVASSVEEMSSLINTSLGPAAAGFEEDMERIAEATNRSQFALAEGASTIIAMTRSMGLGQEEAARFSESMTQIAVDLGSFFNRETESVFRDIQAALGGSSETMQKYGIDVRETTLKQMALEKGLDVTGETLDRTTRAWLIQESILEQASDAMGDAERTSESYENTMRGLEAATMDLKVSLGTALIPTIKDLAEWLTIAADKFSITADAMTGEMGKGVEEIVDRNIEAAQTTEDYIEQAERIAEVSEIWGGLGPIITGTQDEIQAGLEDSVRGIARTSQSYEGYLEILNSLPVRVGNAAFHMDGLTEEFFKHERGVLAGIDADRKFFLQQEDINAAVEEGANILATYTERSEERSNTTAMERALLLDLGDATRVYNDIVDERAEKEERVAASIEAGISVAEEAMALTESRIEAQDRYNQTIGSGFIPALEAGEDAALDLNQALLEELTTLGASPAALNAAAFATGNYSAEQIEAAIQARVMAAEIEKTAQRVAEGDLTVTEATEHLQNFQEELAKDYKMTFNTEALTGAQGEVQRLIDLLNEASGTYEARLIVSSQGTGGVGPQAVPQVRQHGGAVWPQEWFLVGERGPELVQFDRPGQVFSAPETKQMLNGGMSGPMIGGGTSGPTISGGVHINVSGAGDPEATARAVEQRLIDRGIIPRGRMR